MALNRILKEKTSELQEYTNLSESLKQEIESTKQNHLVVLDEYKKSVEETSRNEMGILKGKVEMLEKLLEERKAEVTGSDRELRIRYETVAFELEGRIDELISQVSNKENIINELSEEVKAQEERIDCLIGDNQALQKDMDCHKSSIVPNLEIRVRELEKLLSEQSEKNGNLELESCQQKVKIEDFQALVALKDNQLQEKSDSVKRLQTQYTELESWFAKSCKEYEEKCSEATKLKSSLEVQTTTSANLLKQIQKLESANQDSSDRVSTLQSTSEDSLRKLEEIEKAKGEEQERLTNCLKEARKENEVLRKGLERATEDCHAAEIKWRDIQAQHSELKRELLAAEILLKETQSKAKEQEEQLAEGERREELLLSENKTNEEEMKSKWLEITREMESKLSDQLAQMEQLTAELKKKTDEMKTAEQKSNNVEKELKELTLHHLTLLKSEESFKEAQETEILKLRQQILEESRVSTETIDRLNLSLESAAQQKLLLATHSEKIEAQLRQLGADNQQILKERQMDKLLFEEQLKAVVTQNGKARESLVNEEKGHQTEDHGNETLQQQLFFIKEMEQKLLIATKESQQQQDASKLLYDQLKSKHAQDIADLEVSKQAEVDLVLREQEAIMANIKREFINSQQIEHETYNQRIRELERIQSERVGCILEEQKEKILKEKDLENGKQMERLNLQIAELEQKYKQRIEQLDQIYYETKQDLEERLQSKTEELEGCLTQADALKSEIEQARLSQSKESLEAKGLIEALEKEVERLSVSLKEKELELRTGTELLAKHEDKIEEHNALIEELRAQLKEQRTSEANGLELELERAHRQLKENGETIVRLTEEGTSQRAEIRLLNEEISMNKLLKGIAEKPLEILAQSNSGVTLSSQENSQEEQRLQSVLSAKQSEADSTER